MTDTEEEISCEQARAILALPLRQPNDAEAATVRDYLVKLLQLVWQDGECFDGKRPFGNSSWEYDLYRELGAAGMVTMTFDEDGYVDQFHWEEQNKANLLIKAAIEEFAHPQLERVEELQIFENRLAEIGELAILREEVAGLKEKLARANTYRPNGRCRICGRPEGEHIMYCQHYTGPVTHDWNHIMENPTFGGLDYRCSCGGWFRQGGLAGHGDGTANATPVCPDADVTWRGERP